jgi:hypothetical protein
MRGAVRAIPVIAYVTLIRVIVSTSGLDGMHVLLVVTQTVASTRILVQMRNLACLVLIPGKCLSDPTQILGHISWERSCLAQG